MPVDPNALGTGADLGVPQLPDIDPNFGAMVGGLPAVSPNVTPPANPAQHQQRVAGWSSFLDNLAANPNMQRMLLATGAMLTQPRAPSQSIVGQLGEATMAGVEYAGRAASAQREEERRNRQIATQGAAQKETSRHNKATEDLTQQRVDLEKGLEEYRIKLEKSGLEKEKIDLILTQVRTHMQSQLDTANLKLAQKDHKIQHFGDPAVGTYGFTVYGEKPYTMTTFTPGKGEAPVTMKQDLTNGRTMDVRLLPAWDEIQKIQDPAQREALTQQFDARFPGGRIPQQKKK